MSFSFAQLKLDARRAVRDTFAVEATYQDDTMIEPVSLRVRYHTRRTAPFADLEGQGFTEVVENIDRVIFDAEALAALPVVPCRGAVVSFPDYAGVCVYLDARAPYDGPVTEAWTVTR
jgi:hypothetical protein